MQELACGSPWLQTLNCNSLLISNKPIFAGEISGHLFDLGQHFGGPYGDQRRPLKTPGLVSKQVRYPQLSPLSSLLFWLTLEFGGSFSWIQAHALFVYEALQALLRIHFKVLFFWLRPYSVWPCLALIWHFSVILKSDCFNWSWVRSYWPIPLGTGAASLKLCQFSHWPIPMD